MKKGYLSKSFLFCSFFIFKNSFALFNLPPSVVSCSDVGKMNIKIVNDTNEVLENIYLQIDGVDKGFFPLSCKQSESFSCSGSKLIFDGTSFKLSCFRESIELLGISRKIKLNFVFEINNIEFIKKSFEILLPYDRADIYDILFVLRGPNLQDSILKVKKNIATIDS